MKAPDTFIDAGTGDVLSLFDPRVEIIASVSGGKDSTAVSLWLTEQGIPHTRLFADTGWEHETTYRYIEQLKSVLGPIETVRGPHTMVELIRKKAMFPSRLRRFCTEDLKVRPLFKRMFESVAAGRIVVNAIGIRAEESKARSEMEKWDGYTDKRGTLNVWRPILNWPLDEVIAFHQKYGLQPNPLYIQGASRVGCWPCIYARKGEIKFVAETDPARIDEIRALELEITTAADARAAAKGIVNEHPRAFFGGRGHYAGIARMPIDEAVKWSHTPGRSGIEADPDAGCLRWGMCEHPVEEDDEVEDVPPAPPAAETPASPTEWHVDVPVGVRAGFGAYVPLTPAEVAASKTETDGAEP